MVFWGGQSAGSYISSGRRLVIGDHPDIDGDGYSVCAGDCNDDNAAVHPGAPQLCNGINDNCTDPAWPAVQANEADADGDGYATCEGHCSDNNAMAWHLPVEVTSLALSGSSPTNLAWDSQGALAGPETSYDLVSGALGSGGVNFVPGVCLQSAGGNAYSDPRPAPALGTGIWYLARGQNSCGIGTYGSGSAGGDRTPPACP